MKKSIFVLLFLILIYTRFVGLDWGLPYPMHPDERNMANAIQLLNCEIKNVPHNGIPHGGKKLKIKNCFNPHFFAYGQFSLYLGYVLIQISHLVTQKPFLPINFYEAVMSLRFISAIASVLTVFVLMKIIWLLTKKVSFLSFIFYFLFLIFQSYFIQFSHFGTTESFLMLFYSLIIYCSLQLFNRLRLDRSKSKWRTIVFLALFSGLAIATKISSVLFIIVPIFTVFFGKNSIEKKFLTLFFLIIGIAFFAILFSPHTLISFNEFLASMRYESAVAFGSVKVFYTRQFEGTTPLWYQLTKVFPYVLGLPQYVFAILGFLFLSWKKKEINLLRFAFLVYFIPNAFLYTKWTRFTAPVFPIISLFAILELISMNRFIGNMIKSKVNSQFTYLLSFIFYFLFFIPGFAYLSVYQNPDVRFTASEWIYKNIPDNSYILSETANVVDIPLQNKKIKIKNKKANYNYISFNFYDLDENVQLQQELKDHREKADYILVPSRRIFKNHSPLHYPRLSTYYQDLFSGKLGFQKVAEFTSYPKISFFGRTLIEFPDEEAEETWSVFDHPVVRIYKKI